MKSFPWTAVIWIVVLAAAGAAGFVYWKQASSGEKGALRYETVAVDRGPIVSKITATGTLSALVTVQVGSQVSGRLREVLVDFNSLVTKGQVIARLDPQLFRAALEQARANHMAATANLERAQVQAEDAARQEQRVKSLADQKLVPSAEAETALATARAQRAQVEAARATVQQARAALNQAEVNLGYTTIVSPIDGIVISRNVDVGQTVAASLQAPTLFVIAEDLRKMQVEVSVSEADIGKLVPGMDSTFTVDAYPGERFSGKVRQIRNAAQTVQNVVTYNSVIDVANPELKLRPGMTASVAFLHAKRDDAVRVRNAALRFRPPPDIVTRMRRSHAAPTAEAGKAAPTRVPTAPRQLLDEDGDPTHRVVWVLHGKQPEQVKVRIGISDGTLTEVLEGLQPGDTVITDADDPNDSQGPRRPMRLF